MAVQRVTVTCAASPNLQSQTQLWDQLRSAITAQLPLRNLHWKSASRSSIRTVQELPINIVSFDSVPGDHASQIPGSWLERPLLNFYVLTCDDIEAYKTTARKQIKDWYSQATQRRNQEWIIVHLVSPDTRASGGTFLKMKGTVLDKIRADYNTEKRDRCVQLSWSPGKDNPTAWVDFSSKLKDGLLYAFDAVVTIREEEVKRSEGQRQMPGWNFCTFFILKESLAFLFEGMGLYEDALIQYDELEGLFFQVSKEKNMTWFGTFISPGPRDDSAPLLSLNKKAYRDLILANTITVFDLRVYVIARQCLILGMMGRVLDVCQKTSTFLSTFGKRLREAQGMLPRFFVESWIYSSALSVVEQAENWAHHFDFDGTAVARFSAAKGGLLEMAVHQLDAIGVAVGHLPASLPFSASGASLATFDRDDGYPSQISRAEILSAIKDQVAFYDLYVNLTNKTIDTYAKGNRKKFAVMLHGKLAALDVHQNRLPKAYQTFSELPGHYGPGGWSSLQSFMRFQAIRIHAQSERTQDHEWVMLVTEFLRMYTNDLSRELLAQAADIQAYICSLTGKLREAASELESDILIESHPALTIEIPKRTARPIGTEDGFLLDVAVRNSLPSDLLVDEVMVVLVGQEAERMTFTTTEDTTLTPGVTDLVLRCTSSSSGPFVLEHSEVRFSRLIFQWNHRKKSYISRLAEELPIVVRVPKDPESIDVRMDQPRYIELGTPAYVQATFSTGRNQISHATLKFSSHVGIKFNFSNASSADEKFSLITAEDRLTIMNVPERTAITFFLPHSDASAYTAIKVNIRVEYVTDTEPNLTRTSRLSHIVPTLLPVAVNVQDFFRATSLFTRFSVSTTSNQHVRIRSATLLPGSGSPGGLRVSSCNPKSSGILTITPAQPANFLFKTESDVGQVGETLKLRIVYREFRKEVETLVERIVDRALEDFPVVANRRSDLVQSMVKTLEEDPKWIPLYNITGRLEVPEMLGLEAELELVFSRVEELLTDRLVESEDESTWKEIAFPVDIPRMNIVAAVRVELVDNPAPRIKPSSGASLYAGQPIKALLSINTSFHWGPGTYEQKKEKTYKMRFDVEELLSDWLVSGQKRGDFLAKDGGTHNVTITLVALHHGELPLPRASVTPLPIAGEMTMGSVVLPNCETYQEHGARRILVLPRGGRSTYVVEMGNYE